ncbi:MAG: radical SAM protein [Acidobacteriota bacterium]
MPSTPEPYPERAADRDAWILARRDDSARAALDPRRPYAFLVEDERAEDGEVVPVATLFLTNRECPWRCLMCDLWQSTLTEKLPPGAIPEQIDHALANLPPARQIKLYNSGSYFDPNAIPVEDDEAVAARVRHFERVIVESHPALVGERCLRLRDLVQPAQLEVAMGLETVHPVAGPRLNKRMTLDGFARAADFLRDNGIALRVFILVKPPFLDEAEGLEWALRSLDFAFDCGATVAALIPTRFGNGAMESLGKQGLFSPPRLATLEAALAAGIEKKRGRVFADLWDLERFSDCPHCFEARAERLRILNLTQTVPALPPCKCST